MDSQETPILTYECRVKGYAIADMALLCHFADEETEAPHRGSGGPVSHIVSGWEQGLAGIHAFCCRFPHPLCQLWVQSRSSARVLDESLSSVCFPAFQGCHPQR